MKFYAVKRGRNPGIYKTWDDCKKEVDGFDNPVFKSFGTEKEAKEFIKSKPNSIKIPEENKLKRTREEYERENTISVIDDVKYTIVYTDGSCFDNSNRKKAVAGYGVYFGKDDPRNISEPLKGEKQTNQLAELWAAKRALEIVKKDENLEIRTDSKYVLMIFTQWYKSWEKKNWITSSGKEVENQEVIKNILSIIKNRTGLLRWIWVKGHSRSKGNAKADDLARMGSNLNKKKRTQIFK